MQLSVLLNGMFKKLHLYRHQYIVILRMQTIDLLHALINLILLRRLTVMSSCFHHSHLVQQLTVNQFMFLTPTCTVAWNTPTYKSDTFILTKCSSVSFSFNNSDSKNLVVFTIKNAASSWWIVGVKIRHKLKL